MDTLPPEFLAEPAMALDGGEDGFDLVRKIIDGAAAHLNPGGGILCEIGLDREILEAHYPDVPFFWLDTEGGEGEVFWQHVRLAGLAAGPTSTAAADYMPRNADGGIIGITSGSNSPITGLRGTYIVCSQGVLGKFAKQLDITLDDGNTATGSLQVMANQAANQAAAVAPVATASIDEALSYTVCMGF